MKHLDFRQKIFIIIASLGFLIDYYMEWIFVLFTAAAVLLVHIFYKWNRKHFENKAVQLEKKYRQTVMTRCAYGEALLETISQMADMLSADNQREMRNKTTARQAIVYDCQTSDSTAGELMACEDVAELFTQKLSVYGKAKTS